jgi:hypothetical protein
MLFDETYDETPEKWGLTPLQVLTRAWERVESGTYATARRAIGSESARDAKAGSPIAKAWGLLLEAFGPPDGFIRDGIFLEEEHEKAYLAYENISFFGEKPNKTGELAALGRAIMLAKTKERRMKNA